MNTSTAKHGSLPTGLKVFAACVAAAFLVSPAVTMRGRQEPRARTGFEAQAFIEERNTNAFATILGEVRTTFSDLMFIKTERYLHAGVAYMPHLDYDRMAQTGGIEHRPGEARTPHHHHDHDHDHDHDDHHHHPHARGTLDEYILSGVPLPDAGEDHSPWEEDDHDHDTVPTVIPSHQQDYRGLIGALHRNIKPWMDPDEPHIHTSGEELLPWYRVMTFSDPHNVRAYLIGSWWLKTKRTPEMLREAHAFIREGIEHNPRAFQLHLMQGYIFLEEDNHGEARQSFRRAGDLAIQVRPPEGLDHPRWTDYEEDDARASVRLAVFLERREGDPRTALELAYQYDQAIGGDGRLRNQLVELMEELGPLEPES